MEELLKQGVEIMQKYMDENGITDLSKFPEGPQALEQALLFMPEQERKKGPDLWTGFLCGYYVICSVRPTGALFPVGLAILRDF